MPTYERPLLFIDGQWVTPAGGGVIDVVDPATDRVIGHVPAGTAEDVDAAVAARRAFAGGPWARMAASECGHLL